MKKNLFSITLLTILALVLCFTFVACNPTNDDPVTPPAQDGDGDSPTWQPPEGEYTIPKEAGHNQLTFYWSHPGVIEDCDIWMWWDGKEGSGYEMHPCDYGAKVVVNVPDTVTEVGFIVRTGCSDPGGSSWGQATKDATSEDRFAIIEGEETYIWLKSGDPNSYYSNDGGKTLTQIKKFTLAGMVDFHKIQYSIKPKMAITSYQQVKVYEGDREIPVTDISNFGNAVESAILEVSETLDISKNYRVVIEGYGERAVVPTKIFDSQYFIDNYTYDGNDLGAVTSYYTGYVDKNVEFLSWLNTEAKKIKSDAYIVGEAWVSDDYTIDRYYESGVDSFFLFTGAQATGTIATLVKQSNGEGLGKWFETLQSTYGESTILAPFLGNHDTMRPGSFMPGVENVKMAAGVLSMMSGGTFVYYGEEIGMISKGGNNSDPAKRIAMKWKQKNIYEGCCFLPPENTPWDEESYYYPSVEEQQADETSILNYYKKAMELRNRFPSIARGKVTYYPTDNGYICIITKEYNDEKITIVFNMDTFDQTINYNFANLGCAEFVDGLYATGGQCVYDGQGTLTMPPQSIAIFM